VFVFGYDVVEDALPFGDSSSLIKSNFDKNNFQNKYQAKSKKEK
jgi:hypothetical protein